MGQSAFCLPLLLLNKGIPTTFLGRLPRHNSNALVRLLSGKGNVRPHCGSLGLIRSVCPWHIMAFWALHANIGFLMFGLLTGMNDNRYSSALFYGFPYQEFRRYVTGSVSTSPVFVFIVAFICPGQSVDCCRRRLLPWITIPKKRYRGGEIAFSLSSVYANFKNTAHLLLLQDTGSPYDFLPPILTLAAFSS